MKTHLYKFMLGLFLMLAARPLLADTIINFETNPSLPAQPNNFLAAGPRQTYTQAGVYSVTGGVVLGNPTFLTSFAANGSSPNAYGTSDFGDVSLLDTITFTFNAAQNFTSLSGFLFNGQSIAEDYTVTAITTGGNLVLTYNLVPADSSTSGFRNFSFSSALPFIGLTVTTPNKATNGWDFFVDTVSARSSSATVPESPSVLLLGMATCGLLLTKRRYS